MEELESIKLTEGEAKIPCDYIPSEAQAPRLRTDTRGAKHVVGTATMASKKERFIIIFSKGLCLVLDLKAQLWQYHSTWFGKTRKEMVVYRYGMDINAETPLALLLLTRDDDFVVRRCAIFERCDGAWPDGAPGAP